MTTYLLAGYSLPGTGGGGGGSASTVELTLTTAENIALGQVLYVVDSGSGDAGKVKKADGSTTTQGNARVIAKASATAGNTVVCYREGIIPVLMDAIPAATDNGKTIYVSRTTSGTASLTRPSAPGPATIKAIGCLIGADGVSNPVNVLLDWEDPLYLP